MKNISTSWLVLLLILTALLGGNLVTRAAGTPAPKPAVAPAVLPTVLPAVFSDDTLAGKDPFFPNSIRRQETVVRVTPAGSTAPVVSYLSHLFLKGISGLDGQKLALINNSTVAQGELAEIRLSGQILKIRCREIRERSVIVELEGGGEVREIKLREGI